MSPPQERQTPSVVMVQDGARLHYAVPIALEQAGLLKRVFCEWYAAPGSICRAMSYAIGLFNRDRGRKMRQRYSPLLPPQKVLTRPGMQVRHSLAARRFPSPTSYHQWRAADVARWVCRRKFAHADVLHGFVRNLDPQLCERARDAGLCVTADQIIAPAVEEIRCLKRQAQEFPAWAADSNCEHLEPYIQWERETWAATDRLLCPSEYVRDGLVKAGYDREKIQITPYPIDASDYEAVDRSKRSGPLTVGFVGSVNLRKGAPQFIEVARRLASRAVRFVMVGGADLPEALRGQAEKAVELIGPVSRREVRHWLDRFDVFFFPSTCEGSAGAVMEAMAAGLPVVTTPNSGTVVRDALDGRVVDPWGLDGLTAAVESLCGNEAQRLAMGRSSRSRAASFDLDWYSESLARFFSRLHLHSASGKAP